MIMKRFTISCGLVLALMLAGCRQDGTAIESVVYVPIPDNNERFVMKSVVISEHNKSVHAHYREMSTWPEVSFAGADSTIDFEVFQSLLLSLRSQGMTDRNNVNLQYPNDRRAPNSWLRLQNRHEEAYAHAFDIFTSREGGTVKQSAGALALRKAWQRAIDLAAVNAHRFSDDEIRNLVTSCAGEWPREVRQQVLETAAIQTGLPLKNCH
jgi:uncharacterized lipoprotein NlpE involved in copper resistance